MREVKLLVVERLVMIQKSSHEGRSTKVVYTLFGISEFFVVIKLLKVIGKWHGG